MPACPITTLELTLPADHWLSASKGAAVTGPHDAGTPDKRVWKIQITGQKQLGIAVRRITEIKGTTTTLFARVQTVEQLAPERAAVDFDYQIDILHGSIRELFLEGDAGLQPYEVSLKGSEIKTWQWTTVKREPKGKLPGGTVGVLRIEFRQPVQGKLLGLRVRSLAARPAAAVWSSPALRVRGALSRGETLRVELPPELPQGLWDLGSFQPISITTDPGGTQTLTLAETAPDFWSSRRPMLVLPAKDVELHTAEHYQWHLAPRRADLKADIHYAPARGNLFELFIKLPATASGYQIESLELQPAEMLRGWHLNGASLVVELKQSR